MFKGFDSLLHSFVALNFIDLTQDGREQRRHVDGGGVPEGMSPGWWLIKDVGTKCCCLEKYDI